MAKLVWDRTGEHLYETGIDRGVLYLPNGTAVPWNGLTAVDESFGGDSSTPLYLDGSKFFDLHSIGDFEATLSAITYPEEFEEFDGNAEIAPGLFATDQPNKRFSLSFRTIVGNDVEGQGFGYRIHILYNLIAASTERNYATIGKQIDLADFSWNIVGLPQVLEGFRPTAHAILETRTLDPDLLAEMEMYLYGSDTVDPGLPPLADIVHRLEYVVRIVDNGDGSWTADGPSSLIKEFEDGSFQIDKATIVILDGDTYQLTDTPA